MPWARTQFKWRFIFSHCLIPQVTLHHNALHPCTGRGARRKLVIQTVIAIHWKRPWCRARVRAGEEGGDRGWDAWMSSLTQRTWAWANSGRWWRTRKPGMLQATGLQRVGHDWATEQQRTLTRYLTFSRPWNPICWPKNLKSYWTTFLRSSWIFHFIWGSQVYCRHSFWWKNNQLCPLSSIFAL